MTTQPPQQPPQNWAPPSPSTGPAPGIEYAGNVARFVAYVVDAAIVGFAVWVLMMVFGFAVILVASAGSDTAAALTFALTFAVIFVVPLAYFPWFWSRGGQTPGMRVLHVRVVRAADGGPVSGGQAVLRLIGLYISVAVFYLGVIWILVDGRRQGWHDKIANTLVIGA